MTKDARRLIEEARNRLQFVSIVTPEMALIDRLADALEVALAQNNELMGEIDALEKQIIDRTNEWDFTLPPKEANQ